jgi:hypothetical protein
MPQLSVGYTARICRDCFKGPTGGANVITLLGNQAGVRIRDGRAYGGGFGVASPRRGPDPANGKKRTQTKILDYSPESHVCLEPPSQTLSPLVRALFLREAWGTGRMFCPKSGESRIGRSLEYGAPSARDMNQ